MKSWLLDLVEKVTHALGDISRICFKAVKVDSVSISFGSVQRQEAKIKTIHFDNGKTSKFTYSGIKKLSCCHSTVGKRVLQGESEKALTY